MKDNKKEKEKLNEFLDTPLKRGFDKVYQMILANGLFILLNIHIFLVLFFLQPGNIVLFYGVFGILSFNVMPSYVALVKILNLKASEDQKVMKDYFRLYGENFKVPFIIGIIGIIFMVNTLTLSVFFLTMDMGGVSMIFQGLFYIILTLTLAFAYLGGVLKSSLWKTLKIGVKNLFFLLPGAAASVLLGTMAITFDGLFRVILIIGFSLGAMIQTKLTANIIQRIKGENII